MMHAVKNESKEAGWIYLGVICCFFLSGFAALLYQTAWMRQFSVVFGTSELAVATILASYMAGLALGAGIAARYIHKVTRPVLFYGLLEGLIAVSALAVPYLLQIAGVLYAFVLGGQPEPPDASGMGQALFYLLVTFLVILIPTASMGATLPLLTKYVVRKKEQIGPRVGLLYAINTFGAIGGTLVAAFTLLPAFGLMGTVWFGVGINVMVFLIAAGLARSIGNRSISKTKSGHDEPLLTDAGKLSLHFKGIGPGWILPIMLLSGANAFTYEVLWTRLLSHILGGSVAAFATMLSSFLGGIAIGSAVASRISRSWEVSYYGFIVTQVGIAMTSLCIYHFLYLAIPDIPGLAGNIMVPIIILLPATLFIGATFPFAVRLLATDETVAAESSARVYSWNTFGAIVGAVAAGFFLIPLLKYEGAIKMAVLVNLSLALLTCLSIQGQRYRTAAATALSVVLVLVLYKPAWPEDILRISPILDSREGEIVYYDVGRSSTVLMLERDGYYYIRNNGLSEASIDLQGAPPAKHSQRLLTTFPIIAKPDAKDILVVGFGGGVALEDMYSGIERIDVIELEPKVIEANSLVGDSRNNDPLKDPRVNILINDARSALQLTDKKYDIIVSQPSHPWTAGASHLYTREYMQLAEDHLTETGVYLQWMNIEFIDRRLFKALSNTILQVFPYARVYEWQANVLFFIGSNQPLPIEQNIVKTGVPFSDHAEHFMQKGISSVEDVLWGLIMDENGIKRFAEGGSVITDNFNLMATGSRMKSEAGLSLTRKDITDLFVEYSPVYDPDSWVYTDLYDDINYYYLYNRYDKHYYPSLQDRLAQTLYDMEHPASQQIASFIHLEENNFSEGRDSLLTALRVNPDDQIARYLLTRLYRDELEEGTAPQVIQEQHNLLSPSARAVIDIWPKVRKRENTGLGEEYDEQLSWAVPTDPWYMDAVKLRADWRIKHTDEEKRSVLAIQAMDFIDDSISVFHDLDFYGMRVAASFLANQSDAVVETVRRMIWLMRQDSSFALNNNIPMPAQQIQNNIGRINSISAAMGRLIESGELVAYQQEDIRLQIQLLLNDYQILAKHIGLNLQNNNR